MSLESQGRRLPAEPFPSLNRVALGLVHISVFEDKLVHKKLKTKERSKNRTYRKRDRELTEVDQLRVAAGPEDGSGSEGSGPWKN